VQTAFRVWYYGDVLPNTYYLKMTGVPVTVRLTRGVYVLLQFVWRGNPLLFLLPLVLAFRRDRRLWLLFCALAAQVGYSVYVGGDAWEYWGGSNRYISIAMPGFFVLLSYGLYLVTSALVQVASAGRSPAAGAKAKRVVFAVSLMYAAVALNSLRGIGALAEALLLRPPLHTGEGGENQQEIKEVLLLRQATTPDATVAVFRAGTIPYFLDRYSIDMLGKTDSHIARAGVTSSKPISFREFRPGHNKWDFAYAIGRRQPDVIMHMFRDRAELAKPFLDGYRDVLLEGGCAYARVASPNVAWDRLPARRCDGN